MEYNSVGWIRHAIHHATSSCGGWRTLSARQRIFISLKYFCSCTYKREGVQYYIIVDPDNRVAKIYDLNNGKYIKVKDASTECVDFDLGKCKIRFNFSKLWV